MTEQQHPGDGTSLAEEIRLLVEMVVERAAPWLDGVIAAGHGAAEEAHRRAESADGSSADGCGWCPLCAIVAVVRGERPEFAARVLEQAAQLIALLRAVLADRWDPAAGVHMPGFTPDPPRREPEPAGSPSSPRVQRITVRPRFE
ncbi:hypothetical protein [Amycolatopsis sp. CA-230715]|uniref:hypothetical protein n=1 Tax=Amycolatopsis sp. CA-230715 TaxID=2745196 RepID=UPI001C02B185|nr:hypothetical protein [Amycolatopsis sp. CA-230715]QWF77531.1 hypothetical protein HUW46_00923 [Amycolatopsis sp. CA-230715]